MYEAKKDQFQHIIWMCLTTVVPIFGASSYTNIDDRHPQAMYTFEPKSTMNIMDEQLKIAIPTIYTS